MSMLKGVGFKVALFGLAAVMVAMFAPAKKVEAGVCGVWNDDYTCMTNSQTRKFRKHRSRNYSVTAPSAAPVKNVKKPVRKARVIAKTRRTAKRRIRGRAPLTVGSLPDARAVRRTARPSRGAKKKGWQRRAKGLGYVTVARHVKISCFPKRLRNLLNQVSRHYGRKVRITSGYRTRAHNRRIGGARRSQHIHCTAADFYIPGVNKMSLARYLKRLPGRGGVGTYCGNRTVHLDVGPKRSWHWSCRKKRRYAGKRRNKRRGKVRTHSQRMAMAKLRGSRR